MLPGTGLALKRVAASAVIASAALIPTAPLTAPETALVIWREGPGTSGRGPDQHHYVLCIPADDPVDGPLFEAAVAAVDAYPVPDPVTGRHRYSEGQPCPDPRGEG